MWFSFSTSLISDIPFSSLLDYLATLEIQQRVKLANGWLKDHLKVIGVEKPFKGILTLRKASSLSVNLEEARISHVTCLRHPKAVILLVSVFRQFLQLVHVTSG